ncbi:MAG: ABC transporter substrate-binding protein [Verrucomicrobiota bacterium]
MITHSLSKNTGLISLAALLVFASGCGRPAGHALPEPPRVVTCEPGKAGGRLVLVTDGVPKTFNPIFAIDGGSQSVTRLLFSALVQFDMVTQEPQPGLAESWSVEADQKTWTFKLRKGLRWSDGLPITADDLLFTWNDLVYNPEFDRFTHELLRFEGKPFTVTKVDDLTVRVVTPEVIAPFLQFISAAPVLPKHILARELRTKNFLNAYSLNANPKTIVGSGPFRLKDARAGKVILLERNPEYYAVDKAGTRLPYLAEVQMNVAPDAGMAPFFFFQNQSDVCESVKPDVRSQFEAAFTKRSGRFVDVGTGVECNYFWFNQNTNVDASGKPMVSPARLKLFRDRKFRQAVSCAIDRERMVKEIYGGRAQPVLSLISADNPRWNNPNVPLFGHDPAKARALLAEIGVRDRNGDGVLDDAEGNPVEFSIISNSDNAPRSRTAAMIQEDLNKLGFKVEFRPVTFQMIIQKITTTFDYDSAIIGLGGGGADPATHLNILRSSEPLHQWFPQQQTPSTDWEARIDFLMDAQLHTLDAAARKKSFDEVQAIWAEELPMIPIAAPNVSAAVRGDLANLRPVSATQYHVTWNIEELYLKAK